MLRLMFLCALTATGVYGPTITSAVDTQFVNGKRQEVDEEKLTDEAASSLKNAVAADDFKRMKAWLQDYVRGKFSDSGLTLFSPNVRENRFVRFRDKNYPVIIDTTGPMPKVDVFSPDSFAELTEPQGGAGEIFEAMQREFQLSGLTSTDDSTWSENELRVVYRALKLVPTGNLEALVGLTFRRAAASSVVDGSNEINPDEYGHYSPSEHVIELNDKAFESSSFVIPQEGILLSDSIRHVLHEIGHVVEMAEIRTGYQQRLDVLNVVKKRFAELTLIANEEAQKNQADALGVYSVMSDLAPSWNMHDDDQFGEFERRLGNFSGQTKDNAVDLIRCLRGYATTDRGFSKLLEQTDENDYLSRYRMISSDRLTPYVHQSPKEIYAELFSLALAEGDSMAKIYPDALDEIKSQPFTVDPAETSVPTATTSALIRRPSSDKAIDVYSAATTRSTESRSSTTRSETADRSSKAMRRQRRGQRKSSEAPNVKATHATSIAQSDSTDDRPTSSKSNKKNDSKRKSKSKKK